MAWSPRLCGRMPPLRQIRSLECPTASYQSGTRDACCSVSATLDGVDRAFPIRNLSYPRAQEKTRGITVVSERPTPDSGLWRWWIGVGDVHSPRRHGHTERGSRRRIEGLRRHQPMPRRVSRAPLLAGRPTGVKRFSRRPAMSLSEKNLGENANPGVGLRSCIGRGSFVWNSRP